MQLGDAPTSATSPRSEQVAAPPTAMAALPPPLPPPGVNRNFALGMVAVLLAALSSAFASVYFERLLKSSSRSQGATTAVSSANERRPLHPGPYPDAGVRLRTIARCRVP